MYEAREALKITRRMHALATTPEGALLTRGELERLAEQQIAAEHAEHHTKPREA